MNFKNTFQFLLLLMITSLFFQCSKNDQVNQVGAWDARFTTMQFSNDSLTFESISTVEMILRSDETGIVRGTFNEATLEWDLISDDTKIVLIENYFLSGSGDVFPQESIFPTIYEILRNEKNSQEWHYELEFTMEDGTTRKNTRTWKLDLK